MLMLRAVSEVMGIVLVFVVVVNLIYLFDVIRKIDGTDFVELKA